MDLRQNTPFQIEVDFTLPRGFIDDVGVLHRQGVMRLATAGDEILPLRDPRVHQNEAYLAVIILARVITRLGDLQVVDTRTIEGLFASDMDYLQQLYEKLNRGDGDTSGVASNGVMREPGPFIKGLRTMGEA